MVVDRPDVKFHDLRRRCATRLVRAGVRRNTPKDTMGNKRLETRTRYYVDTVEAVKRVALVRLGRVVD